MLLQQAMFSSLNSKDFTSNHQNQFQNPTSPGLEISSNSSSATSISPMMDISPLERAFAEERERALAAASLGNKSPPPLPPHAAAAMASAVAAANAAAAAQQAASAQGYISIGWLYWLCLKQNTRYKYVLKIKKKLKTWVFINNIFIVLENLLDHNPGPSNQILRNIKILGNFILVRL